MDQTLKDLVDLLIKSIPTIVFFVLLTFYLQNVFFKPLARVLEERRRQTEGVRELARLATESADQKTSEFERAMNAARAQIHKENEAKRQAWLQEQQDELAKARVDAGLEMDAVKKQVADEVSHAEAELAANVGALADRIVAAVQTRRAA